MLTIRAEIKKEEQRSDKTYNVKLRFTFDRRFKRLSTSLFATSKDLTKDLKFKQNSPIKKEVDELIRGYQEKCAKHTLHPNVKDVFRSRSDYSEYLFAVRAWCENCDSVKLAYHITEPDIWYENGTETCNFDSKESTDSIWVILHNPMIVDVGTDYNELVNRMYVCTIKRPGGNDRN